METQILESERVKSILYEGFDDFRRFVNPWIAKRVDISNEPSQVVSTSNGQLVLNDQRLIEDFHGTQAYGHRHPHITSAVVDFLNSTSANWFPSRVNPYSGYLAKKLCERSNFYDNAFFASSGSEAVESALKLARAVTRRPRILGFDKAYHGCTMGSCALMGQSPYKDLFSPHLPDVKSIPLNQIEILERELKQNDVAAVIVEPIQVEGGVRELTPEFISALCELTKKHGTLLVADEVQTGLGRTGQFLASESWPRRPEAVLLGKHLGGGLVPISAMLTLSSLFEKAYGKDFETSEAHNSTFSGNAIVSIAALAGLEVLDDSMIKDVKSKGEFFREQLKSDLKGLSLFSTVRGQGLTVGIVVQSSAHPWLSFEHFGIEELNGRPSTGLLLCHRLYKRGYFCFVCGHDWSVLRIQPRFNITLKELSQFSQTVQQELEFICNLN